MTESNVRGAKQSEWARFLIKVLGTVDPSWSDSLGGMVLTTEGEEGLTTVTTLSGPLPDQAALMGVLNLIYDLGLPVLSVEQFTDEEPALPVDSQQPGHS